MQKRTGKVKGACDLEFGNLIEQEREKERVSANGRKKLTKSQPAKDMESLGLPTVIMHEGEKEQTNSSSGVIGKERESERETGCKTGNSTLARGDKVGTERWKPWKPT